LQGKSELEAARGVQEAQANKDDIKGRAKEAYGSVTGDEQVSTLLPVLFLVFLTSCFQQTKREGQWDQTKASAKKETNF